MNEELESKLDEIKLKIFDLVEQKRALEKMLREDALAEILDLMHKHKIGLDEIKKSLRVAENKEDKEQNVSQKTIGGKGKVIQGPSGEVWKGRGRPPKWLSNLSETEKELLKDI